jgi:hypothetical protein
MSLLAWGHQKPYKGDSPCPFFLFVSEADGHADHKWKLTESYFPK